MNNRRFWKILWLCLTFIAILLPSGAYAKDVGPQGSAESFIPEEPPIETETTPIYERYAMPAYKLDSEAGVFSASTVMDGMSNLLTFFGNLGALMTIYAIHFLYTEVFSSSLNAKIGEWTLSIRDNLFAGEFMAYGLVVLVVILAFNLNKPNRVAEKIGQFLKLFFVATILLSFMTPLLNLLDRTERAMADTVFWVYLAADPNSEKVEKPVQRNEDLEEALKGVGKSFGSAFSGKVEQQDGEAISSFGEARDRALVGMGNQFWKNFRLVPWQMAEFGQMPSPSGKDDDGNPVYKGKDKQIQEDTKKILNLNPMVPNEYVQREQLINQWTNNSVWGDMVNNLVPGNFEAAGTLLNALQERITGKEDPEVRYPSMTAGNSAMRLITVVLTFLVGSVYGLALLFFAGVGLIMKLTNVILAVMVSFLLFTMFVPSWGWNVMTRWAQYFLTTGLYKVLLSLILMIILFVSGVINAFVPAGVLGQGLYLFAHLCFGVALFLGLKMFWDILMIPAHVINEAGAILRAGAKQGVKLGWGAVSTATRTAAATVTGNPALLAGTKGAVLSSILKRGQKAEKSQGQNQGVKGKSLQGIKSESPQFIPEGFSVQSSQTPNFAKEISPKLSNPYEDNSKEAILFNDMKDKGLNPYAPQDQQVYEKKHLKKSKPSKETVQAFKNIKDHSQEFSRRHYKQERIRRRAEVVNQLDQMAKVQKQRKAETSKQKSNSRTRRLIHSMKQRAWGKK